MQQVSESDKEIAAIILVVGLFIVFSKAIYENALNERLTLYNLFHPVKKITARERLFILNFLKPFYDLTPLQRKEFLVRFAWFKSKKHFVFYGNIENKKEIKAYVAASAVLLTLGLRNYRFEKSIKRVIVYPSKYYSKISKNHHVGEYNPRLRTLVFSAESLKKNNFEAKRFQFGLAKVKELFDDESFSFRLSESSYFRDYGKTNFVEFFAVATENFVETPSQFKRDFPNLYEIVKRMLNLDLNDTSWQIKNSP